MQLKTICIIGFILISNASFCQTYTVQIEDREKTVNLTNQAIQLIDENKISEAVSALINAISIDSTYHTSYFMIYKAYLFDKNYFETAILYLKKGKRIFNEDDEMTFYLGEVYRMNSDLKNAIYAYSEAINQSKTNGEESELFYKYFVNRGTCYYKSDSLDSAISDYNSSLKIKPDYEAALLNRGICFYKKGNKPAACTDWNKARENGSTPAKDYIEKYCINHK